jgi:DNA modification methylase
MERIIHGDRIEHLRALPDKAVPLILTDPPYGMNMARRGSIGRGGQQFTPKGWDVAPPAQELAGTSFDRNSMVFNSRWSGYIRDSREKRYADKTQKALDVMTWCVLEFSNPGETALDPFCGSGSYLVAAMLSRRYIGIEREEEYIKIAEERLRECVPTRQRLFIVNAT